MRRIRRTAVLLLLSGQLAAGVSSVAPAADRQQIARASVAAAIAEASRRYGVPAHWLRAIMRIESRGVVHATSGKGAMGLMQIMPATWTDLRMRYGLGADPYDVGDNILAGAAYVREMHDRYGSPGFLAAYNAGPRRYEKFLSTGRPLPAETRNYVATLAPMIGDGDANFLSSVVTKLVSWTHAPLFAGRIESVASNNMLTPDRQRARSTNVRSVADVSAIAPRSNGLFVQRNRSEGAQ